MDRIVDLVSQLEPETAPPSTEVQSRERDAQLGSNARADKARTLRRPWLPRHKDWFVAISGAPAVAVVAAMLVLPATVPNTAILKITIPSGFRQVVAPESGNANRLVVP